MGTQLCKENWHKLGKNGIINQINPINKELNKSDLFLWWLLVRINKSYNRHFPVTLHTASAKHALQRTNNSQASLLDISCQLLLQKKEEGTKCNSGAHFPSEVPSGHVKHITVFFCQLKLPSYSTWAPKAGSDHSVSVTCASLMPLDHSFSGYYSLNTYNFVSLLSSY